MGKIQISYVPIDYLYDIVDIFTKPLATVCFRELSAAIVSNITFSIIQPRPNQWQVKIFSQNFKILR